MTCSLNDRITTDLRSKNIANSKLEVPLSKEKEASSYIRNLTQLAKKQYKVSVGEVFTLKKQGNKLKMIPNEVALDAIEKSPEFQKELTKIEINKVLRAKNDNSWLDNIKPEPKTEKVIESSGTLKIKGLPNLEITC